MKYKELLAEGKVPIEVIETVGKCADDLGLESYIVGGYVRDLLLKRTSKDVDFVCVGSGIRWAQRVAKEFERETGDKAHVSIFKNFGTAMVKSGDWELEFVGARKESYRRDSRKPIVEDGTLEDDQNRRDFTINAMAISVNQNTFGELIDPFDGMKDLKQKVIRTPLDPEITFSDDPLRMMRAVRFASQLEFDIEPKTFDALVEQAERLSIISAERISIELNKIILSRIPSYGFKLLFHSGLLHQFFPEMVALQGVEVIDKKGHKDNFYHTLQVLDNISLHTDNLWLRWAAILHDIAKPPTKRFDKKVGWTFHGHEDLGARWVPKIFRRLKLPMGERMKYVQKLVRLHLRPIALVSEKVTDSAVRRLMFEAGDNMEDLMTLCKADVTSKNDHKVKRYLNNFRLVEEKMKEVEERDHVRNFQPPITGEEIMKTFNIRPCREIGDIKSAIKEAILDGQIKNEYESARELMFKLGREMGLSVENNS